MSETKFTPGPWEARKESDNMGEREGVWGSVRGDGYYLARIWNDTSTLEAGAEANAHLIAAAPELYDALKAIVSDLPSKRDWLDPDIERMARAALAKAEGKATT